jgi:hypothetical protein
VTLLHELYRRGDRCEADSCVEYGSLVLPIPLRRNTCCEPGNSTGSASLNPLDPDLTSNGRPNCSSPSTRRRHRRRRAGIGVGRARHIGSAPDTRHRGLAANSTPKRRPKVSLQRRAARCRKKAAVLFPAGFADARQLCIVRNRRIAGWRRSGQDRLADLLLVTAMDRCRRGRHSEVERSLGDGFAIEIPRLGALAHKGRISADIDPPPGRKNE